MKRSAVKFKLLLLFCFQLVIIILLALFSNKMLERISDSSKNILKNNLSSVEYCANMSRALSGLHAKPDELELRTVFEKNLRAEFGADFEIGEKELAEAVQAEYFEWIRKPSDDVMRTLRGNLRSINEMNISAMRIKEMETQKITVHSGTYIIVISAVAAIVLFIFTFIFIGGMIQPTLSETASRDLT